MKVLIIKLSSLGDVVHTLPALASLRKGLKGANVRIDWLVEEAASGILLGHPLIDEVIVVKRGWLRNFHANAGAARALSARRYDLVLDFQGLLKSAVWVFFSKGARRLGFENYRELSHLALSEKLPAYDPERHAVERYMDLAVYAGGEACERLFPLTRDRAAAERVNDALCRAGLSAGGPFFVMAPCARWSTKLWGEERFASLGEKVAASTGLGVVLVGDRSDAAALERIRSAIGGAAVSLAGETGLKELAELMRMARFAVTVDSGPMHVAAAVGTRVVALFGPTAPNRTGPYGSGHVVLRSDVECSPCFLKECKDMTCMSGIDFEEAVRAAERMAAETGGAP